MTAGSVAPARPRVVAVRIPPAGRSRSPSSERSGSATCTLRHGTACGGSRSASTAATGTPGRRPAGRAAGAGTTIEAEPAALDAVVRQVARIASCDHDGDASSRSATGTGAAPADRGDTRAAPAAAPRRPTGRRLEPAHAAALAAAGTALRGAIAQDHGVGSDSRRPRARGPSPRPTPCSPSLPCPGWRPSSSRGSTPWPRPRCRGSWTSTASWRWARARRCSTCSASGASGRSRARSSWCGPAASPTSCPFRNHARERRRYGSTACRSRRRRRVLQLAEAGGRSGTWVAVVARAKVTSCPPPRPSGLDLTQFSGGRRTRPPARWLSCFVPLFHRTLPSPSIEGSGLDLAASASQGRSSHKSAARRPPGRGGPESGTQLEREVTVESQGAGFSYPSARAYLTLTRQGERRHHDRTLPVTQERGPSDLEGRQTIGPRATPSI